MSDQVIQLTEDESAAVEVVRVVASILDTPIEQLSPLSDTIDTDLLDHIAAVRSNGSVVEAHLTFDYCGLAVSVAGDGEIEIR